MPRFFDLLLLFILGMTAPVWLMGWGRRGKLRQRRRAFWPDRSAAAIPEQPGTVWFHGVSVGEVHLLIPLIQSFQQRWPAIPCGLTSTTEAGQAEARKRLPHIPVVAFPMDFSWNYDPLFSRWQPRLIVVAESEFWPNWYQEAQRRGVPVVVVNGRLSPRSARRWAQLRGLTVRLGLSAIQKCLVQTTAYAEAFIQGGIPAAKVHVTGSIKYDGGLQPAAQAQIDSLARWLGWSDPGQARLRLWVAGSTHAPEEELVLQAYTTLKATHPDLQLLLVPRSVERFEAVWQMIQASPWASQAIRRSQPCLDLSGARQPGPVPAVALLDTIGELSAAWSLATVGLTGGSWDGQRGGQSMIEPAARGVPVVFGPHVWNFQDAATQLLDCGGARTCAGSELALVLDDWLRDEPARQRASQAARAMVMRQQGAIQRTLDQLQEFLPIARLIPSTSRVPEEESINEVKRDEVPPCRIHE